MSTTKKNKDTMAARYFLNIGLLSNKLLYCKYSSFLVFHNVLFKDAKLEKLVVYETIPVLYEPTVNR